MSSCAPARQRKISDGSCVSSDLGMNDGEMLPTADGDRLMLHFNQDFNPDLALELQDEFSHTINSSHRQP